MGRIKSTLVKRTTKRLLQEKDLFSSSFDHNKGILSNTMPSKKIRNKIAGYMARLLKVKKQKAPKREAIMETPQYEIETPSYS